METTGLRLALLGAAALCWGHALAGEQCAAGACEEADEEAALLQHQAARRGIARDEGACFIHECGCPADDAMTTFPDKRVEWGCTKDNGPMRSDWCNEEESKCVSCNGVWCSGEAPGPTPAPEGDDATDACSDVDYSRCRGASGASMQYCMEEEDVKCCVDNGGTVADCCADKNMVVQSQDVCQAAAASAALEQAVADAKARHGEKGSAPHAQSLLREGGSCFIGVCGCPTDEAATIFPDKIVDWVCSFQSGLMNSEWCNAVESQCVSCDGVWCAGLSTNETA